jgi:hypothetical protein
MQTANLRYGVLALILLASAVLYAVISGQPREVEPRWPRADDVFVVAPWSLGRVDVAHTSHNTDTVTRVYRHPSGTTATFMLTSNKAPKLYGPGAEVPILGAGYQVEVAPADLVGSGTDGIGGLVTKGSPDRWLYMYAYGERRGLLGNGLTAWSMALIDGVVGAPNDYYKMYLGGPADDPQAAREVAQLARTLFPRIAAWYAAG